MQTAPDLSELPCSSLKGVGNAILQKLNTLGLFSLQDLLFHLPYRYEDRTKVTPIYGAREGAKVLIQGVVQALSYPTGGKTRLLCELSEGSRRVSLRFFHVYPAHKQMMEVGNRLLCFGELRFGPKGLEMVHPECQLLIEGELNLDEHYRPVYPTTEGLTQGVLRKLMQQALTLAANEAYLEELLPLSLLEGQDFTSLREALLFVHKPPKNCSITLLEERKHPVQKRLVFEELLAHRLGLLKLKAVMSQHQAPALKLGGVQEAVFLKALPYELTAAQKRVSAEIHQDLGRAHPMLRLVQGDVGSGKTVVAALAALRAIENGCQAAVMAPTELLAEQHYRVFKQWLNPLGLEVVLLTGQMKAKERREALLALSEGKIQLAVGTHALFQKDVIFSKLALIIIDEQHRFGVHQRAMLREKGIREELLPHQLIMTATPIPRTLAMSMYADLDCSIIDELPRGRLPIQTRVMANTRREEVLTHVNLACQHGRQAYWVCPLIDESEVLECQAAEKTAEQFKQIFPKLRIGLLHGRLKAPEKEETMQAFKEQKLDLLVATTVIEVGVDVPSASLMIIENAERLGLAQLHQLRGRVGRGSVESHCLLLYKAPLSTFANKRLAAIRDNQDGFKLAEHDLQLRGPGDVLGIRQTGELSFKVAELLRDSELLPAVTEAATQILSSYSNLIEPLLKRWLHEGHQYRYV